MIKITNKADCCGCEACEQVCPKHCITMQRDDEGFAYPMVDANVCVNCGLCEKVCPVINKKQPVHSIQVLAVKNRDREMLRHSSSGGIFVALAKNVIAQGGVVFGVGFADSFHSAHHTYVENMTDISQLMGSKYFQSSTDGCFVKVKEFLNSGRKVLFSGTSCQISALRNFLCKDYDNLLCVDIICHGVPSPKIWQHYLDEVVGENCGEIYGVRFRDKSTGWKNFSLAIDYSRDGKQKHYISSHYRDAYMRLFLQNYLLRPSCYRCPTKAGRCNSDVTIADFWGIELCHPEMDDKHGCGLCMINSEKGRVYVDSLDLEKVETTMDNATRKNKNYFTPVSAPVRRGALFDDFVKNKMSVRQLAKKYTSIPLYRRIVNAVRRRIKI